MLIAVAISAAVVYWRYALPVLAVIVTVRFWWGRRQRATRAIGAHTLAELYNLSPEHFEQRIVGILEAIGWTKLNWVGGSGDRGADITGIDPLGRKCVVQAKRYMPGATIGSPVVQSLIGSQTIYGADRSVLVTTGAFTHQAVVMAGMMDVELVDGVALVRMASRVDAASQPSAKVQG